MEAPEVCEQERWRDGYLPHSSPSKDPAWLPAVEVTGSALTPSPFPFLSSHLYQTLTAVLALSLYPGEHISSMHSCFLFLLFFFSFLFYLFFFSFPSWVKAFDIWYSLPAPASFSPLFRHHKVHFQGQVLLRLMEAVYHDPVHFWN